MDTWIFGYLYLWILLSLNHFIFGFSKDPYTKKSKNELPRLFVPKDLNINEEPCSPESKILYTNESYVLYTQAFKDPCTQVLKDLCTDPMIHVPKDPRIRVPKNLRIRMTMDARIHLSKDAESVYQRIK